MSSSYKKLDRKNSRKCRIGSTAKSKFVTKIFYKEKHYGLFLDERIEDFVLTKLDKKIAKPNNLEILGHCFYDSGMELGQSTQYGNLK